MPPGPVYPAVHADFTASQAAMLAAQLKNEQQAPGFQQAFQLFSEARYMEAIRAFEPLAAHGNSMAIYYIGRAIQFGRPADLDSKYSEFVIPDYFLKAAMLDNPYAMVFLDKYGTYRSQESTVRWRERAYQYWTIRAAAKDPEAFSSLAIIGADMDSINNMARGAYLGDTTSLFLLFNNVNMKEPKRTAIITIDNEYPDWHEVAISRMKVLADQGNPLAQYKYGYYVLDYDYIRKAADQCLPIASFGLSINYNNWGGGGGGGGGMIT
ncbi:hypothetical protein C4J81_06905 [Deltaproteobacteria bacterium Smac51]|nr:hypothetical protein C4J81_06905 [Deltaproteobacteria bacterium Smac51]